MIYVKFHCNTEIGISVNKQMNKLYLQLIFVQ